MSAWKARDKAVCVEAFECVNVCPGHSLHGTPTNGDAPQVGTIYLVDSFQFCYAEAWLALAGLDAGTANLGYRAAKFRKVVTATERESIGMERLLEDVLR